MNHIYRTIWNATTQSMEAASEYAKSVGGGGSPGGDGVSGKLGAADSGGADCQPGQFRDGRDGGFTRRALAISVMLAFTSTLGTFSPQAWANPTGGSVAAGSATIAGGAGSMTINQTSQNAVLNWQSFSIGANESVRFIQPNSASVALNRVLGNDPSNILGSLTANGKVFLVNPNGVLFARGASVNVGGLIASTLDINNSDFMAGRYKFAGSSAASVINQGNINAADGGYVALLGANVSNDGVIAAKLGSVVLAGGKAMTLDVAGDGLLNVAISEGAVNALVKNGGMIKADGGIVLLSTQTAGNLLQTVVNNTGIIQARTIENKNGVIKLLGDMQSGTVNVAGTLDASASAPATLSASGTSVGGNGVGGNGGFIETSAAHVKVAPSARVTTQAANGSTGTWLIDPTDYTIAASGGDITGLTLSTNLASTNVSILSSSGANTAGNGDIHVNDAVNWSAHKLTLTAARDININAVMTASGTSSLAMNTGTANGADAGVPGGSVKVGMAPNGTSFTGRVDFGARTGTGFLAINGIGYTVINSLGAQGSTSGADLQGINGNLNRAYALGSDIDASATLGWNAGAGFAPVGTFAGMLNGLGHTVSGLVINRPVTDYVGLFLSIGGYGTLVNVGVNSGTVIGGGFGIGGLAGNNDGLIGNSFFSGTVTGNGIVTGGLVGTNTGSINNSRASATVTGASDDIGGLVGQNYGSISNSYASGAVTGSGYYTGGLVGENYGSISNSYASGAVTGSGDYTGGVAGSNAGSISNSYASGAVTGGNWYTGGVVGSNAGSISNSYASGAVNGNFYVGGVVGDNTYGSVSNSFWNTTTSGQATSDGGTGKTSAEMMQAATFTGAGWNASNVGGDGSTWRIYEGQTAPLLRSFLTPLTMVPTYDGTGAALSAIGGVNALAGTDQSKLFGTAAGALTLSSSGALGNYLASASTAGVYSNQSGYDISNNATRTISTPGSAVGDVRLDHGVTYTSGQVIISALNNIDLNGQNFSAATGSLALNAGAAINNAGGVNVGTFDLQSGTWNQVAATLPGFNATDFKISGGTFIRALGGDGTAGNAFQLTDVYGLQGVGSAGMLDKNYKMANHIDASGTVNWNTGTGFRPIDGGNTFFSGSFDGQGHTINNLTINLVGGYQVAGLFSSILPAGTVMNVGLAGGSMTNNGYTGALAGANYGSISNSYATSTVTGGGGFSGGLVGYNQGSITNSYASGPVTGSATSVGGLVGYNILGSISNSYASGAVAGSGTFVGALVGQNIGGTITSSFWNTSVISALAGVGTGDPAGATGLSNAQMQNAANFSGWNIATRGGSSAIWRIYEGHTAPLLRSFLTPLNLTPDYTGDGSSLANIGSFGAVPGSANAGNIFGTPVFSELTLTGGTVAGTYVASATVGGLYSNQQGYDLSATRTISTPGSVIHGVRLDNNITWTSGQLTIAGFNGNDLNGKALSSGATGGIRILSDGNTVNAGSINTGSFELLGGTWSQVGAVLPAFNATDFRISDGTFIRALGGDGTAATPYQLTDAYGLQGAGSAGMLGNSYRLANNIDASGTAGWNTGAGFKPIGDLIEQFNGSFDGQSHTISSLTINRPTTNNVGLFGVVGIGGSLTNVGLTGGAVTGYFMTGGLAGQTAGSISNSYSSSAVTGYNNVIGGLAGVAWGNSSISNSYASGAVTGNAAIGGLVGVNNGSISNSYASGAVAGSSYIGGLAGQNFGSISNSYASGAVVGANDLVGGLAGINFGSISNSYASGAVTGTHQIGGLVGQNLGDISNSYASGTVTGGGYYTGGLVGENDGSISNSYASGAVSGTTVTGGLVALNNGSVSNSFWNITTSGQSTSDGGTGKTSAEMMQAATFTGAGWIASNAGGDGSVWRIYEGQTAPLLRSLLTPLNMALTYDGSGAALTNVGAYSTPGGADGSKIFGTPVYGALALSSSGAAGNYLASAAVSGQYSNQSGYDINSSATRTISTPGSAVGDVRLDHGVTYTSGQVIISALGNIDLNGQNFSGATGSLALNAGAAINNAGGVNVGMFDLQSGTWNQVAATLPGFNAPDFRISDGTFIRALGGDGTAASPYQLTDAYGLQGAGSAGMLGNSYRLANNIDASSTAGWNTGAGFKPIGDLIEQFNGSFDGQSHTISSLTINRPTTNNVGLFGFVGNSGSLTNVGLTGGAVTGYFMTGGLAGQTAGSISNSYSSSAVTGGNNVIGGLAGYNWGSISNSYASGAVTGNATIGGLAGANDGNISNSYASGAVAGSSYIGGLAGQNFGGISNSYASGAVVGANGLVGGLAGINFGSISKSYASGAVTGTDQIGGLVGSNFGDISNSYASGAVTGSGYYTGGLVGENYGSISNSYASGAVTGNFYVGGVAGDNTYGSISNSFWNTTTSGQATSGGGTGKTSAEMMQAATFTGAGWIASNVGGDSSVWRIYEGNTAPLLRSFLTTLTLTDNTVTYNGATQTGATSALPNVFGTTASGRHASATPYASNLFSNQQGYDISGGSLTINKANLTLAAVAAGKTYDGNTSSAVVVSETGVQSGDSVSTLTQSYVSKNALGNNGSTLVVDAGYIVNDGNGGGNYNVTTTAASGTITPKSLGYSTSAATKVYDGNTMASASLSGLTGLVGAETIIVTGTGATFNTKDVTTANLVTLNSASLADGTNGGLASNYIIAGGGTTAANITIKALTYSTTAANKTYDGNTTAAATLSGLTGLVNTETVIASAGATFNTKDVATANLVTVNSATLADGANGGLASNYSISAGGTAAAVITAKNVGYSASAANKVYDGNSTATATLGGLTGLVGAETVIATSTGATFNTKDVLTANLVTVNSVALADGASGGLASNYQLAAGGTVAANITAKALTYSTTATNKVYDGNTAASVTLGGLSGLIGTETVTATSTGATFNTKDVATANLVTVNSGTLADGANGGLAGNYQLAAGGTAAALITTKSLGYSASAVNKVYDGTTTAAATLSGLTGLVGTETVIATSAGATFNTKDVTTANLVTVNAAALADGTNGGLASNYQLAAGGTAAASITPKTLGYSASAANKVYDGNTTAAATLGGLTGLVGTETVIATSTGATFNTKDVTTANLVTVNSAALADGTNGGLASNYQLAAGGTATANINLATLTLTASNVAKTYGETALLAGFTPAGLIGSETIGSVSQTSTGAAPTATVAGGPYAIMASNASGGSFNASNYAITYVNGVLTVAPATLTQTANLASFVSGSAVPALSGTVTGFVNGETLTGTTTGTLMFITPAAANAAAGSYAIDGNGLTVNGGASGNYVLTQAAGNATALTVTAAITGLPGGAQDALSATGALTGSPPPSGLAGDGGVSGGVVEVGPLGALGGGAESDE